MPLIKVRKVECNDTPQMCVAKNVSEYPTVLYYIHETQMLGECIPRDLAGLKSCAEMFGEYERIQTLEQIVSKGDGNGVVSLKEEGFGSVVGDEPWLLMLHAPW
jgi:hypothetical protein